MDQATKYVVPIILKASTIYRFDASRLLLALPGGSGSIKLGQLLEGRVAIRTVGDIQLGCCFLVSPNPPPLLRLGNARLTFNIP